MRRLCRLLPPYLATLALVFLLLRIVPAAWGDADEQFPMLAYLSSLQGFWMAATGTIGAHWLAPTWTLAVEEHFYLLTPALIVFTPRRALAPSLALVGVGAILFRAIIGLANPDVAMGALVLLPGRADLLVWGLLAALLHSAPTINWAKLMPVLRLAPLVGLVSAAILKLMNGLLFDVFGPTLVGAGCAGLILAIVRGAPEAARFQAPALRFLADNGYCLYLIHLTVLGVMHGLVLGTRPDLATAAQWAVTLAAVPVCIFVSWAMTKLIEEPFMAYGRRWKWGSLKQAGPSGRAVAQASRSTAIHKLFKA